MRFRNTLHVFVENFKNTYKILLIKLIVSLIAGAVLCTFILPEIFQIGASEAWGDLSSDFYSFFTAMVPGHPGDFDAAYTQLIQVSLPNFSAYLLTRAGEIVGISVGLLLVSLVVKFIESICYFALGDTLDDRMQTYGEMTFGSSLVKNLGRASKYSLVYVPISFLFDAAIIALCYLSLWAFKIFFGLFFSVVIIVLMQALKLTISCFWMPAMTTDKHSLKKAMKVARNEGKGQFWKTFSVYVILLYLIIAVNVLAVLCTFSSALILTIPASFALLICFQYVNYYTVLGRKYFITFDTISVNKDKGDSEHFFDRVLIEGEAKKETATEEEVATENDNNAEGQGE